MILSRPTPTTIRSLRPGMMAFAFILMVGVEPLDARAQEPRDGTYRVDFEGQSLTLTLTTGPDGGVEGRLHGATLDFDVVATRGTDVDGDPAVEGMMTGGGASGLFWLYLDEDDEYGLIITPLGGDGETRSDQAAYYAVERMSEDAMVDRSEAMSDVRPPSTDLSGHPIVGRWATQVVMNSPAGSVATQLFMEFRPDGTMIDLGSRAMGGIRGSNLDTGREGTGERGAWRIQGDLLYVSYQGSPWVPFARYQVDSSRLALTYLQDGSTQLWDRQLR